MSVQVVTVFAKRDPRPECPSWEEYLPLLRLQRDSARWFGHGHLIVTDGDIGEEFNQLRVNLPNDLMPAMIAGVIAKLKASIYGAGSGGNLVFVDGDCLIARELNSIFESPPRYDLGLCHRIDDVSPINNGAMYVPKEGVYYAAQFMEKALEVCGTHWAADQQAISQVAAPVPRDDGTAMRHGCNVAFLDMKRYGAVPKRRLSKHGEGSYVIHFKGETKAWMSDYAKEYVFVGEPRGPR